jgi:hypothetical protein
VSGPGDPLPRILDAWRENTPTADVRRDHLREWWPDLGSALDALVALAPAVPQQRRTPGPEMEAALVVACLVRRYGDRHPEHPGITSATIQEEDLVVIDPGELTVLVDPLSGAMYLRHKGSPLDE